MLTNQQDLALLQMQFEEVEAERSVATALQPHALFALSLQASLMTCKSVTWLAFS